MALRALVHTYDGEERRDTLLRDRRASHHGGRRRGDHGKPWWMRRRLWLVSAMFVWAWWRKLTQRGFKLR